MRDGRLTEPNPEEEKERIIASIVENAQSKNFDETIKITVLDYGSKTLQISHLADLYECNTYVKNKGTEDLEGGTENPEKKAGQTRLLYEAAKRIMQQIADKTKVPFTYRMKTDDKNMIKFALSHGAEIFEWDEKFGPKDDQKRERGEIFEWEFVKVFHPSKTK